MGYNAAEFKSGLINKEKSKSHRHRTTATSVNHEVKRNNKINYLKKLNDAIEVTNTDCQNLKKQLQLQQNKTSINNLKTLTNYSGHIIGNCNETSNENEFTILRHNIATKSYSEDKEQLAKKQPTNQKSCSTEITEPKLYTESNQKEVDSKDTKVKQTEEDSCLRTSCINCYPLSCQRTIACKEQSSIFTANIFHQIPVDSIQEGNYSEYKHNNSNVTYYYNNQRKTSDTEFVQEYRKTLHNNAKRHEHKGNTQRSTPIECDLVATSDNKRICNSRQLQKTLSYASNTLTLKAATIRDNMAEVMGNCATMLEYFIAINMREAGNMMQHCTCNTTHIINNSKSCNINKNKSEPCKGYCQHKNILKNDFIVASSDAIARNSCYLHNAISSNNIYTNNFNTTKSNTKDKNSSSNASNKINNIRGNASRFSCRDIPYYYHGTAHTDVFNYIGHNYYHFLRNTVNLYTASSVIVLMLCYLTTITAAAAATTKSDQTTTSVDKHPIQGIDWSKFDESSSDKEILDLLLEKKRYDKRLLPPVNDEDFCCGLSSPDMATELNSRRPHKRGTLTVNVNVLLLSLASPDESSLKYEVEFLLNQQWNDPRLQYGNKSHYDFLNALHHHDSIWTPDTYFIMHGDFKDPIIPMHFALRIYRNGTITYAMRRHLILSCQGSLHIFPFDDPKCSFSMESISYEEAQIKYVWKNDEDTLRKSPSLTTLNAYLIKNQTTACDQNSWRGNYSCLRVDLIFTRDRAFYFTTVFIPGIILVTSSFITFWLEWNAVPARSMIGNYSCLQVELTFTRDRAYYFTTVFIPGIILVTSSFITFWLEWNAVPARVMIGVTTMLNFFTTSNGFRSTLPVVSNLTAMNVWDGVCMCFIYASLLEFVCVNYMGRKRPQHNVVYRPGENPVTQRLPAVLSRIGVILASPLEIIEREFHAALSSEKAAAGLSTTGPVGMGITTTPGTSTTAESSAAKVHFYQDPLSGRGIIASAVQNIRSRSIKRRSVKSNDDESDITSQQIAQMPTYEHVYTEPGGVTTFAAAPVTTVTDTTMVAVEHDEAERRKKDISPLRSLRSASTNTPPIMFKTDLRSSSNGTPKSNENEDIEQMERQTPLKPPRKKSSRSTSPAGHYDDLQSSLAGLNAARLASSNTFGEKKREGGGPNEIVACTTCGGSSGSPCTHSANNGCATETCFVQVRKKEPPHPIRIAKTIDVIARITFPTAYAIFLIFFFVHYKGFS